MDSFRTVAEIAATLIGFVAIFIAFRASQAPVAKSDFLDFLQSAIAAIVFAFVPELLQSAVTDTADRWRLACGLFGTYHLVIMIYATRLHVRHGTFTGPSMWTFVALSVVVIALKLSVGTGWMLAHAFHIYLLGLVWMVLNSLFVFYTIVIKALSLEE